MRGILEDLQKMAAILKVIKEAFESAVSFSLKMIKKPALKLKIKKQKALKALLIQKMFWQC